uniref:Uncharacterized protein n=1 Tax=Anopheles braziliensis TaxID=58242 RepID=A0A2M3ZIW8_9DIPT
MDASWGRLTSDANSSRLSISFRMLSRCSSFGRPIWNWAGMRRRMALSRSCGRFVAPITITVESDSVLSPSHSIMNCVFIMAVASWSDEFRARRNESISSMKMMHGCILTASENTADASFCDSPYHLSVSMATSRLMNRIPASFAVALAINVLPHPGGPYSSTPLGAW